MPFPQFDRRKLKLRPLAERSHDLDRSCLIYPDGPRTPFEHDALEPLAERIVAAAAAGRAVILFCGAHVIRKGNGPLLVDLMERGADTEAETGLRLINPKRSAELLEKASS